MIDSRRKLKFYIKADAIMNEQVFPQSWLKRMLFPSLIEKFLRVMRKLEYYDYAHKKHKYLIPIWLYYKKKYEQLKVRTGFDIPINTIGYGVRIGHLSTIVINGNTKIGNYCCMSNNITIADASRKSIGNHVFLGSNIVIAKNIKIADGCTISSCSLQNKSAEEENMLWGGVNSRPLKKCKRWTEQSPYDDEFKRVEFLKEQMFI